ncbi:MAG: 3-hydroxyacyl-CoA dehydrogenase NAD-binding domain-containing protein [Alphaproteobacteria bacterium]|nr:3-hydroxyacyl-CoA dehydrogenase NAD-binding domain-containing protein [Alphaproteobacteria bacterium]
MENFKFELDEDGIAVFTFDVPGRSMNTITAGVMKELPQIVEQIKTDPKIKGAVLTSGKASGFCAGADLGEMGSNAAQSTASAEDRLRAAFEGSHSMNRVLRSLETCGKSVACALEGLALGGGLEIALATHYRVAADNPKIQFGLPESKVGLLPGAGGTQRLPRLIGVQNAAMMILQGTSKNATEAKALGFINDVVEPGQTLRAAKKWLKGTPDAVQPWDKKGYRVKDGPYSPGGGMAFVGGNAVLMKQSYGNYPAQKHIMSCLYEGIQVPMDAALRIESRYFVKTLQTPQARAMIRSLFLSMQELSKGANRPEGFAKYEIKKVAVIGAGFMGAGVSYVQAMAGIETVLLDTTIEGAEKGKAYSKKLLDKRVSRGQMTQEKADATLALIKTTTSYDDVKGADFVVEAVFENREIKAEVTKQAEAQLAAGAVFGSNTSTLPITGLAEASVRPENFIGVHFFSPVDKMGLVELILGKKTSQETVAKAIDYVLKIKKTPIVVNDSRGFYTSRIVGTFIGEGLAMLGEGIKPAIIENIGKMAGMPVGPLSLNDEVALDLSWKIREQTKKDLGGAYKATPVDGVIEKMVVDLQRFGRKNGKGFYDYPAEGKKKLWPGITDIVATKVAECPPDLKAELIKRILYIQSLETARCFEEGILTSARDADIGSILGWGFAPYTGGTASLIDGVGVKKFVEECDALAAKYGDRFKPNALLREMAEKGETFYGRYGSEKVKQAA